MATRQITFHQTNPVDMDKWGKLPDGAPFYLVLHEAVGSTTFTRTYQVDDHGMKVPRTECKAGEYLLKGRAVPAKEFGPGVDLQRLVDLGAIRQVTPWEEEEILRDFSPEPRVENPARSQEWDQIRSPEPEVIPASEAKAIVAARAEKLEKVNSR